MSQSSATDLRAREEAVMRSVAGAGVVVTGGGSGIGAALARRFAAEGARVVVNDLNGAAAARVAAACGGTPAPGDAASEEGVAALVAAATEALGEIDMFCANAGVAREADSEDDWEASWQVNVMAHVRAARLLLPRWLERGNGHLICTVSAAGLLTMLGSAPYSATKHAALSFAESLAPGHEQAPGPGRGGGVAPVPRSGRHAVPVDAGVPLLEPGPLVQPPGRLAGRARGQVHRPGPGRTGQADRLAGERLADALAPDRLVHHHVLDPGTEPGGDREHRQGERADDRPLRPGDQQGDRWRAHDRLQGAAARRAGGRGQLRHEPGKRRHQLVGHLVNYLNSHAGQVTVPGAARR